MGILEKKLEKDKEAAASRSNRWVFEAALKEIDAYLDKAYTRLWTRLRDSERIGRKLFLELRSLPEDITVRKTEEIAFRLAQTDFHMKSFELKGSRIRDKFMDKCATEEVVYPSDYVTQARMLFEESKIVNVEEEA